jgi:two-component sensor histidine kinase
MRWISAKAMPQFSNDGQMTKLVGHVIDITDMKRTEERLRLLSQELNHRVSNTFAIMNSMIRHASKKSTDVDQFAQTLMDRLGALARSNRVLVASEAERSSLKSIIDMELECFAGWQGRIHIKGDAQVWFSGEASEALALIFHELLTNAVKHGALSVPEGRIDITIEKSGETEISIRWAETGGPMLKAERGTGIGSSILHNAMRDQGKVDLDFKSKGLICKILVHDSFKQEVPSEIAASTSLSPAQVPHDIVSTILTGKRIMVVEDDPVIGLDIAEILRAHGAVVLGPFGTVATALKATRETLDAAFIDVNLGRNTSDEVALNLSKQSIPFIVLSGQVDTSDMGAAFLGAPVIGKPFAEKDIVSKISGLIG